MSKVWKYEFERNAMSPGLHFLASFPQSISPPRPFLSFYLLSDSVCGAIYIFTHHSNNTANDIKEQEAQQELIKSTHAH